MNANRHLPVQSHGSGLESVGLSFVVGGKPWSQVEQFKYPQEMLQGMSSRNVFPPQSGLKHLGGQDEDMHHLHHGQGEELCHSQGQGEELGDLAGAWNGDASR